MKVYVVISSGAGTVHMNGEDFPNVSFGKAVGLFPTREAALAAMPGLSLFPDEIKPGVACADVQELVCPPCEECQRLRVELAKDDSRFLGISMPETV